MEYRLRHLKVPRARAVLQAAADKFGWAAYQKKEGRGRGIAFAQYKSTAGAFTAVAFEVEVNKRNGRIRILKAVAANDSGHMVNPDGVANQIEGGIVQAVSWVLKEQVRFDRTRITTRTWDDYPILRFSEAPPVEVSIIDRPDQPSLGVGEAVAGPAAAAIANAVFDAIGVRVRDLPLTRERLLAAIDDT